MSGEMVERVARAIWFDHVDQQGYPNGLPTWDELVEADTFQVAEFRSMARAAIEAMRKPSRSMILAYRDAEKFEGIDGLSAPVAMSIMIDAALQDEEDKS